MKTIETVDSDNLFLQYDIYHMQRIKGELAGTLERHMPQIAHIQIAHIQIADNPGRHEPGTGEIKYPFLFNLIDRLGYEGWVGCEYRPLQGTSEGPGWMRLMFMIDDFIRPILPVCYRQRNPSNGLVYRQRQAAGRARTSEEYLT